jgi:hypothetical protein
MEGPGKGEVKNPQARRVAGRVELAKTGDQTLPPKKEKARALTNKAGFGSHRNAMVFDLFLSIHAS